MPEAQRLGEILRQERERKGITLEQAAEDTRIRERFLAALESGDHRSLPGAVYTKGFLRNYADYLDLSSAELLGGLAMQVFWILVGIGIFSLVWRRAIRRYSAVGN